MKPYKTMFETIIRSKGVTSVYSNHKTELGVSLRDSSGVYNFNFTPDLKEEKIRLSCFHSYCFNERDRELIESFCDGISREMQSGGFFIAEDRLSIHFYNSMPLSLVDNSEEVESLIDFALKEVRNYYKQLFEICS